MGEISKKVEEMAKPICEKLGFELVEVLYLKKTDGMELNLSIYKENGNISIEDCEKVSKALDEPLEILNPTKDAQYNLVVGSLGLDRQMKTTRDFERNINKEIEVKLYKMQDNEKSFIGKLKNITETEIEIETTQKKLTITRANIASAKLYIKF